MKSYLYSTKIDEKLMNRSLETLLDDYEVNIPMSFSDWNWILGELPPADGVTKRIEGKLKEILREEFPKLFTDDS